MLVSGYITSQYIATKYWIYNNVLAVSFTVYFVNKLLVTNFKNAVIYNLGMLMYDIFWGFGSDVMVTVATQLDLPIKLLFPADPTGLNMRFNILGIGDIALPGVYCAMMLRYDFFKAVTKDKNKFSIKHFESLKESLDFDKPYFTASLVGYTCGILIVSFIFRFFNSAQPALLYINP